MTLSYPMYVYYTFSSGAPSILSPALTFRLFSLSPHSKGNSVLWSAALQPTIQWQERIPPTHPDEHKNLEHSDQHASSKPHWTLHDLLCYLELNRSLLDYCNASAISTSQLTKISLAVSLSPLEAVASYWIAMELLVIIFRPDFDAWLLSNHITDLNRCHDICNRIVRKRKQSWPLEILTRKYYRFFTVFIVA